MKGVSRVLWLPVAELEFPLLCKCLPRPPLRPTLSSEPGPRATNKARGPAHLEVKCSLHWTLSSALPHVAVASGPSTALQGILHLFKWVKQGPGSGSLRHSLTAGASPLFTSCFLMAIARRAASEAGQLPPLSRRQHVRALLSAALGGQGSACPADPSLTPSKGCFGKGIGWMLARSGDASLCC